MFAFPSGRVRILGRMTRDQVRNLLAAGLSITEVADALGLAKSTVCYHARRLGHAADARFAARYDWTEIRRFYEEGNSLKRCREHFGFSVSAWCDAIERGDIAPRPRSAEIDVYLDLREVSRSNLRRRLAAEGLKQNRCERCGIEIWRGRSLSMALHHVNGNGNDNRLENLQILCPNCHSQTPNFSGRNARRRLRIVRNEAA
jgi:hypothetical protein